MQQIRFPQNEFQSFEALMLAEVDKAACRIARLIEEDLIVRGWPQDASLGSEVELGERYGDGRTLVCEAVRILEVRGTARMVRGPSGPNSGLRVSEVDHSRTANFLMGFVLFFGTTEPQLGEAEEAIQRVRYGLCDDIRNDADLVAEQVSVALDLFDDVLGAIRQMMSGNGAIPGNPTVLFAPEVLNCSRAGQTTERILRECTAEQWAQGHRLGSEEDLCFRYGADRGAFRQAVRVLESAGAAEASCGRGRGLVSRAPRAGAVARLVSCLLASSGIHPDIVMRIFQLLSVEVVALAAERATRTTCQQIATALSSLRRALDRGRIRDSPQFSPSRKRHWKRWRNRCWRSLPKACDATPRPESSKGFPFSVSCTSCTFG
ncbi:transcriptional regulator [Streptomyces griseorubiginosus]|uniref:transcriptional regulator n=1 Tax=Streptomyces griseorubiginosus TaxID=67304 RepID=UPI00363227E2